MAKTTMPSNRTEWLRDLVRVEITLWNGVDARLRREHGLSLAFFEALAALHAAPEGALRVGELARALRITVGAASKLVDRIEAAGLIRRELDAEDRRASRVAITAAGAQALAAAEQTHSNELAALLDPLLSAAEQQQLHALIKRLLAVTDSGEAG